MRSIQAAPPRQLPPFSLCSYINDAQSTCSAWLRTESPRAGQREGYRDRERGGGGMGMGLRVNVNAVNVNFGLVMYV